MRKLQDLTKEGLIALYIDEKRSLEDIGKLYGVSRVAVYDKLKKFDIKRRSKSQARLEAQKQGKLPQQYFYINEDFFSKWSADMAYVLGLFVTDGCISKVENNSYRISLCLNDRELLGEVAKAMGSEHTIATSKYQKGLNIFIFGREKIAQDLIGLGMKPRKSYDLNFPDVPKEYLRGFIRGVFDGDGSVFFDVHSKNCPVRTKFVSSSKDFIKRLEESLQGMGLPQRVIYEQKTKNGISYMFRYGHNDSRRLFEVLYKGVPVGSLFLERKYSKFQEGFNKEGRGSGNGKRAAGVARAT